MSGLEVVRSYLRSLSVNMLSEHKTSAISIKSTRMCVEPSVGYFRYFQKIRNLCAPRIKAYMARLTSVLSVSSVVKNYLCGFVSIRGSRDK